MTWNEIIGYIIAAFIGYILPKAWNFFTIKRVRNSILRWLAFFFHTRTLKTKSIKSNIETYLNQEIKVANTRAFGSNILIDEKVKVEWVRLEEEETILTEEGEVIIRLGYNMDENRNYIEAVMKYLEKSFLPDARPYLSGGLFAALLLEFAHRIALDRGKKAFRYYNEHYLSPQMDNKDVINFMDKTAEIKKAGFFTPVFLRELNELGLNLSRKRKRRSDKLNREIEEFIDFLYDIANMDEYRKARGEDPPLDFIREFIRTQIVLVKRAETTEITGHKTAVNYAFRNGAFSVYIAGVGRNADLVKDVYTLGFNTYKKQFKLLARGCTDIEREYENEIRKAGRICLIERMRTT
ncbi:hypothetical protein J7K18_01740 [bacterium]|nr:hypothetical protein [bacterium]